MFAGPLMTEILISLDLDGTSVCYEPVLQVDPVIIECLKDFYGAGVRWVMNSDRYTEMMVEIAGKIESDLMPLAVLSSQRFVHLLNGGRKYCPLDDWNQEQVRIHDLEWNKISGCFKEWSRIIEDCFKILDCAVNEHVFAFMVPGDQTPDLRKQMLEFIMPWPNLKLSGNMEWTFILHSSFSKARILSRCAEELGVKKDNIIAVGDGMNDVSMLDGSVAAMVGCPANACREVIETVRAAGGIVSEKEQAAGTVEVVRSFLRQRQVCSGILDSLAP
jgi:HAD superfamily hydrolase (TIGR01484 family)